MHSSRMCTTRTVTVRGVSAQGGVCPGVSALGDACPEGMCVSAWRASCDLSHHAFDVTCMLSQHQLIVDTSAAAYIA